MVYDGDCRFCGMWIRRWQQSSGDRIDYLPYQNEEIAVRFPEIPREQFEKAVQLIEPDGNVYGGAEAVFKSLALNPRGGFLLKCYRKSPLFARITETAYGFVARHRTFFSWLTRVGWGNHVERPAHLLTGKVFLSSLAIIYLIAFLSLWSQVEGLVGSKGILPAETFITAVAKQADSDGISVGRFWNVPTLCWISASDWFLNVQCAAGVFLAGMLLFGIAPAPSLFLLWLIYLSLTVVGREFLGFQWENLLLETGFLAIFLSPLQLWRHKKPDAPTSRIMIWLLRWLLFHLMLESGLVKLLSGDETWRNLTALAVHYETQPLPTWIGWWAHQMPLWFHKITCAGMFFIELVVPFFFFAPRRLRFVAGILTASLQIVVLLTGNYTYFNLLTLALCIPLLDDFALRRVFAFIRRRKAVTEATTISPSSSEYGTTFLTQRRIAFAVIALLILCFTTIPFLLRLGLPSPIRGWALSMYRSVSPLRSFNSYGLFAVMTTSRPEIIVEGSNDGVNWLAYEFKHKPGDLKRRPGFVAPHQPRLDWQMWFAALGNVQGNMWFVNFSGRLLQGSPEVLDLIEKNPFPGKPPRYVRALVYDYRFTTPTERKQSGHWWRRELKGVYLPPISLKEQL
jgi:predicted DCC family thiol-disulfide oxidoreductase YuxK